MTDQHAGTQRTERAVNDNRAQPANAPQPVAAKPPAPTTGEKWRAARPTKMMTLWICLGAVLLTMGIGFTWGGWKTADAAQKQATTTAQTAVVDRLAGICVAQFGNDAQHAAKLGELQALGTSARSSFMSDGGWATMPGETEPDSKVVSACVKQVMVTAGK